MDNGLENEGSWDPLKNEKTEKSFQYSRHLWRNWRNTHSTLRFGETLIGGTTYE